jgi:actin-related protein
LLGKAADTHNMIDGKVVVLQPGSCNLRIGLASSGSPVVVPHAIARKLKSSARKISTSSSATRIPNGSNARQRQLALMKYELQQQLQASGHVVGKRARQVMNDKRACGSFAS